MSHWTTYTTARHSTAQHSTHANLIDGTRDETGHVQGSLKGNMERTRESGTSLYGWESTFTYVV